MCNNKLNICICTKIVNNRIELENHIDKCGLIQTKDPFIREHKIHAVSNRIEQKYPFQVEYKGSGVLKIGNFKFFRRYAFGAI